MENDHTYDDLFEGLNHPGKLSKKQEDFAQHYVKYGSGSKAYEAVYSSTCAKSTAYSEGCKLLKHPKISMRITELQQDIAQSFKIETNWMFQQYATLYHEAVGGALPDPKTALKALDGMNKMLGGLRFNEEDIEKVFIVSSKNERGNGE